MKWINYYLLTLTSPVFSSTTGPSTVFQSCEILANPCWAPNSHGPNWGKQTGIPPRMALVPSNLAFLLHENNTVQSYSKYFQFCNKLINIINPYIFISVASYIPYKNNVFTTSYSPTCDRRSVFIDFTGCSFTFSMRQGYDFHIVIMQRIRGLIDFYNKIYNVSGS